VISVTIGYPPSVQCDIRVAEFYQNLLRKWMRAEMARLTLARKIAAITLHVWKKGEAIDAQ
jgi:hypothetical protein